MTVTPTTVPVRAVERRGSRVDPRTLEILTLRDQSGSTRRRGWLVRRVLLAADLIGLLTALVLAHALLDAETIPTGSPVVGLVLLALAAPVWVVAAKLYGLYDQDEERTDHSTVDELVRVFFLVTFGVWVAFAGAWLAGQNPPEPGTLVGFWALAIVSVVSARAVARAYCRRQLAYLQNTIIVGAGEVGQLVARKILNHREYGLNIVGFVDDEPKLRRDDLEHLTLLGSPKELEELIHLLDVERIIVAFSNDSHDRILELLRSVRQLDVQIDIVPRLYEIVGTKVGIHTVEGVPLVGLPPLRLSRSSRLLKRTVDVCLAALGLALLAPVFLLTALAIKLESRGPVFFRQVRMGRGEQTFRIFKFRTMVVDADAKKSEVAHLNMHAKRGGDSRMFKVPDDPRITRVGRYLRRWSIDELPQLLNVLRGEMSLVGPRPLILDEDRFVADWARKRLDLKPGITGLWQVLGRSEIPFEEMTKLDYLYVTNWSLAEDFRLIFRTIPSLFRVRHAY